MPHTLAYVDHLVDPYLGPCLLTAPACTAALSSRRRPMRAFPSALRLACQLCEAVAGLHQVGEEEARQTRKCH